MADQMSEDSEVLFFQIFGGRLVFLSLNIILIVHSLSQSCFF